MTFNRIVAICLSILLSACTLTKTTDDNATVISDLGTKTSAHKTILITAATGELGASISHHLASLGYDLVLAGRNQQKLNDLQGRLQKKYLGNFIARVLNFSDRNAISIFVNQIQEPIDGVVLISGRPNLSKDKFPTAQEWTVAFEESFIAPLETLRLLDPLIKSNASIIVLSGITSKTYMPAYPNTNIMRLVWAGHLKNLAHFFGKRKIRVNAISPAVILTEYNQNKIQERAGQNNISYSEQLAKETDAIPIKQYGAPRDVADLTHFLLSESSKHINAVNIPLDGGESNAY